MASVPSWRKLSRFLGNSLGKPDVAKNTGQRNQPNNQTIRKTRKALDKKKMKETKKKAKRKSLKSMKGGELSIQQLAEISDKALDDVYHYGRSSPGTFGWLANIESVKAATAVILAGETDIEKISDAIHEGWNKTALADYENKLVLASPTPDDKKKKRFILAQTKYQI